MAEHGWAKLISARLATRAGIGGWAGGVSLLLAGLLLVGYPAAFLTGNLPWSDDTAAAADANGDAASFGVEPGFEPAPAPVEAASSSSADSVPAAPASSGALTAGEPSSSFLLPELAAPSLASPGLLGGAPLGATPEVAASSATLPLTSGILDPLPQLPPGDDGAAASLSASSSGTTVAVGADTVVSGAISVETELPSLEEAPPASGGIEAALDVDTSEGIDAAVGADASVGAALPELEATSPTSGGLDASVGLDTSGDLDTSEGLSTSVDADASVDATGGLDAAPLAVGAEASLDVDVREVAAASTTTSLSGSAKPAGASLTTEVGVAAPLPPLEGESSLMVDAPLADASDLAGNALDL